MVYIVKFDTAVLTVVLNKGSSVNQAHCYCCVTRSAYASSLRIDFHWWGERSLWRLI